MMAVLSPSQMVNAQEIVSEETFDYEWYLEQHPDLAAITTDPATVYQFYLTVGLGADWNGRISPVYITNETDLKCYGIVDSITNATMTQREKAAGSGGHAWNQVKVDGQWYQVDVTWDDGYEHLTSKGYITEFFQITPENMMYDHTYNYPDRIHY